MENHRIFIVEDDKKIAQLLADTLRKYQYDVAIVEDFDQVTKESLAFDPHLILLDINLPCHGPRPLPLSFILKAEGGIGVLPYGPHKWGGGPASYP